VNFNGLHGVILPTTELFITTTLKISNPTAFLLICTFSMKNCWLWFLYCILEYMASNSKMISEYWIGQKEGSSYYNLNCLKGLTETTETSHKTASPWTKCCCMPWYHFLVTFNVWCIYFPVQTLTPCREFRLLVRIYTALFLFPAASSSDVCIHPTYNGHFLGPWPKYSDLRCDLNNRRSNIPCVREMQRSHSPNELCNI
jgi:hypothetical protein